MRLVIAALLLTVPGGLAAQDSHKHEGAGHDCAMHAQHHPDDKSPCPMMERGAKVMGVDQAKATHVFTRTPTGGTIRFTIDDLADTTGTATIRAHLREIATAFGKGDFRLSNTVHDTIVPGTRTMAAEKARLRYAVTDVPGGGVVTITATSRRARAAVHEFLAYQTKEHGPAEAAAKGQHRH